MFKKRKVDISQRIETASSPWGEQEEPAAFLEVGNQAEVPKYWRGDKVAVVMTETGTYWRKEMRVLRFYVTIVAMVLM